MLLLIELEIDIIMVKITYAPKDIISAYDLIGLHFMKTMFDMDYREMALSDESWLSDFCGCELTDDDWIKINEEYQSVGIFDASLWRL